jgi:predicted aspartyl protease
MIAGVVRGPEASIQLLVGGRRRKRRIEAVIDTGFTGTLTLPPRLIRYLKLRWDGNGRSVLGDGSVCFYDRYVCRIWWDGMERPVVIDEASTDPLMGMQLMKGYELKLQVRHGGKVTLKRLRR